MAVLHAVIDRVVDDYGPVIEGLDNDMAEIEDAVFDPNRPRGVDPSQRIFKLKREVLDLHRNTEPFLEPLSRLAAGNLPGAHPELASYFRDVEDHLTRVVGRRSRASAPCSPTRSTPTSPSSPPARTTTCARSRPGSPSAASRRSSGAIYGMNFEHMPELGLEVRLPARHGLDGGVCFILYRRFKHVGWL